MPHISPPISTSLPPSSSTPALAIVLFVCEHVTAIKWALCLMFAPRTSFWVEHQIQSQLPNQR